MSVHPILRSAFEGCPADILSGMVSGGGGGGRSVVCTGVLSSAVSQPIQPPQPITVLNSLVAAVIRRALRAVVECSGTHISDSAVTESVPGTGGGGCGGGATDAGNAVGEGSPDGGVGEGSLDGGVDDGEDAGGIPNFYINIRPTVTAVCVSGSQPARSCLRGSRNRHAPQQAPRQAVGLRWAGTLEEVRRFECEGYVEGGGQKPRSRQRRGSRRRRHWPGKHQAQQPPQPPQQPEPATAAGTNALLAAGGPCTPAAQAPTVPAGTVVCSSPLYAASSYQEHRKRVCSRCFHVSTSRLVEKCSSCDQAWWCSGAGGGASACDARASKLGHRLAPHAAVCPALQRFNTMSSRFGKDTASVLRLILEVLYFRVHDPKGDEALRDLEHHRPSDEPTTPDENKMERAFGLLREALAACAWAAHVSTSFRSLKQIYSQIQSNAFGMSNASGATVGQGFFLSAAMLNHSCDPNCRPV